MSTEPAAPEEMTTQMVIDRTAEMRALSATERQRRIVYGVLEGRVVDARKWFES